MCIRDRWYQRRVHGDSAFKSLLVLSVNGRMVSATSFGKGERTDFAKKNQIPGPGTYYPQASPRKNPPSWSMKNQPRKGQTASAIPGPGSYEISAQRSGPFIKMRGRLGELEAEYRRKATSPGPGSYNPQRFDNSPNTKFTTLSPRGEIVRSTTPGPGSYEIPSTLRVDKQVPNTSRPTTPRDADLLRRERSTSPGPGSYYPAYEADRRGFWVRKEEGTFLDKEIRKSRDAPGPGQYEPRDPRYVSRAALLSPKSSSVIEMEAHMKSALPGPGAYEPNYFVKESTRFTRFEGVGHQPLLDKHRLESPGPGTYSPEILTPRREPGIGKGSRTDITNGKARTYEPGPGAYERVSSVGEGPQFSFGQRVQFDPVFNEKKRLPGPGTYEPPVQRSNSPVKLVGSTASIPVRKRLDYPGPGSYYLPQGSAITYKFPKSPRDSPVTVSYTHLTLPTIYSV
eukprot:TRINITY_DN621_c0_g3_i4.p1 TRINITY_DN621_c0_g3~~TRINITY_DN621_c0_g3_i4.p1  ORF type:complete len:454 (-),score=87.95 TRINITY_DN621_c0_g3_i4:37-1398(-)